MDVLGIFKKCLRANKEFHVQYKKQTAQIIIMDDILKKLKHPWGGGVKTRKNEIREFKRSPTLCLIPY